MLGNLYLFGLSLAVGATGLQWFYVRAFSAAPSWLIWTVLFLPWLTIHVITFCKVAPFGPRPFRRCLLLVVGAYALLIVGAEDIQAVRHLPTDGVFSLTLARVLMYIGCISFIPFARAYLALRNSEATNGA